MQAAGQSAYKVDHGRVPVAMEAERAHFGYGLIGRPVIEGDAVGGDEDTRAVLAEFTMNVDFLRRCILEEHKKFGQLSGGGRGESADWNRDEMNAQRIRACAFLIAGVMRFAAQINDRGDAELFEFGETG